MIRDNGVDVVQLPFIVHKNILNFEIYIVDVNIREELVERSNVNPVVKPKRYIPSSNSEFISPF